jgi:hypothetical protein
MVKKYTRYKCEVLMSIKVTCSLYKLAHAFKYLQCNEFFAIRKYIIHLIMHEYVRAINEVLIKNQM